MLKHEHLIGVPFELGTGDCFKAVRDIYKDNFGIELRNYARPKGWDADRVDIIGMSHEREGFYKVSEWTLKNLLPGDVLCMAIGTSVPNHLATYLGGNMIFHHKIGSMSNAEVLRDFWRRSICYVLRHKDVDTSEPPLPETQLLDVINERNRIKAS